jgi:hypothetical protein
VGVEIEVPHSVSIDTIGKGFLITARWGLRVPAAHATFFDTTPVGRERSDPL